MDRRSFLKASAFAAASIIAWPAASLRANAEGKKVLRLGYNAEVLTLDPIKTVYGPDIIIQGLMFARLLHANADRTEVGPGLAESWDISDDGKTYTFHLADAKFSDGSPSLLRTSPSATPACDSRRTPSMPRPSSRW